MLVKNAEATKWRRTTCDLRATAYVVEFPNMMVVIYESECAPLSHTDAQKPQAFCDEG